MEVSAGLLGWNLMSRCWLSDPGGKRIIVAHISAEGYWNTEVIPDLKALSCTAECGLMDDLCVILSF